MMRSTCPKGAAIAALMASLIIPPASAQRLPAELQKYTVYVAAATAKTAKKATVDAFIAHLTGPEARGRLDKAGYTAPE